MEPSEMRPMMPLVDSMTLSILKSPPADDANYTWKFAAKTLSCSGYGFYFYINKYPTSNCQVTSIGKMDYILTNTTSRAQALGILSEGYRLIGVAPNLILIDVDQKYMATMDSYFLNNVVVKSPYESTSGTKMCLYLVKMPKT